MVFKERTFHGIAPEMILPDGTAELESRVANCLAAVDGIDATAISVTAKGNIIVLTGNVLSIEEVERAEEAASTVEGVDEILNQLIVT
ncbi:BON domain-containing protein [Pararhizobium gei]|uniref:BON domain-containing protein n=1 Tax=Pararhizobium gei TaxID=1395951 RepID=UPI0023DADAF8|nr:BON domain-containing protein [Rhizobium gei]